MQLYCFGDEFSKGPGGAKGKIWEPKSNLKFKLNCDEEGAHELNTKLL